jgi:hypothetical protein
MSRKKKRVESDLPEIIFVPISRLTRYLEKLTLRDKAEAAKSGLADTRDQKSAARGREDNQRR